jgi:adenylate cyclase
MRWPWQLSWQASEALPADVSAEFRHAMMREMLKTERLRIKALIVTALMFTVVIWALYTFEPAAVSRLWHGQPKPDYLYSLLLPFVLLESALLFVVSRQLARDRDLPAFRRYIGAFLETSVPTLLLMMHIDKMGSVILSTLRLDFWLSTFTGFVAAAELFGMAWWYHPDPAHDLLFHMSRSVVIFGCGLLAGAVGMQLRRQFETSIAAVTAKDRVTNLFGQHVSPQVAERLLAAGTLPASDIRRVAVMFVDFRSFTTEAQARAPQQVVDRLDGAFAVLVDILDRHGGIVNKFLGDGFLALFGAPFETEDAPRHAVEAAREMIAAMARNNAGSDWPLRIGIGLHFGEVVAGNVGSPRRKEYTVIGDTVNLASRIEALNKQFGSQFLVSSVVRDALGEDCGDAVPLGEVEVRGYDKPMPIWRLG